MVSGCNDAIDLTFVHTGKTSVSDIRFPFLWSLASRTEFPGAGWKIKSARDNDKREESMDHIDASLVFAE